MKTDFAEYGFEAEMGTDLVSSEMILENLFQNQWLDNQTDLIMFEQTYFNANVNIIVLLRISFEHVSGGAYSGQLRSVSIKLALLPSDWSTNHSVLFFLKFLKRDKD